MNSSIKIKKNIELVKTCKQTIIKIKSNTNDNKIKSMDTALENDEVLLWGLNQIDSILLGIYENNYIRNKKNNKNQTQILTKTTDTEFNPNSNYSVLDLDFLNNEYERIDNELSNLSNLDNKYEILMDHQDKLYELIGEFESQAKFFNSNPNNSSNPDDKIITKKRKMKLKPYYWIGQIPDGYREATEEEAIENKKVSLFGKYKASRELFNIHEITGSLYLGNLKKKEIELKIFALKGKMGFYKKEYDYHTISLNSGKLSQTQCEIIKDKLNTIKQSYKKTLDVYNFYVENYKKNYNHL